MPESTTRVHVGLPDFIEAWQSSESIAEVAEKTGLKEGSIQARASKYRSPEINEKGEVTRVAIPLKTMPRGGGARLQVNAALELLAKMRGMTPEELAAEQDTLVAKKRERMARAAEAAAQKEADESGDESDDEGSE